MKYQALTKQLKDMKIQRLEQTAALAILILAYERPRYITELVRTSINPSGIGSQDSIRTARRTLVLLGLIKEETEEGPRPKTFLKLTEKGKRVAKLVSLIDEKLESSE